MVGIYKITNPKGKVYIGQSIDIERREKEYSKMRCKRQKHLYYSFEKYGWEAHRFEILEECTLDELDEKEQYWGEFFNVLEEGLNHRLGKGRGSVSEETKKKIGKTNSRPKPKGFGDKISKLTKGKKRSEETKLKQSKALKGREGVNKGMSWKWDVSEYNILQYDLDGNFIKRWRTITEASEETKIKGISECVRGATKTSGGFIWRKYSNNFPLLLSQEEINKIKSRKKKDGSSHFKPVQAFNEDGELIGEYPSVTSASIAHGVFTANIVRAMKSGRKYKGIIWKYKTQ